MSQESTLLCASALAIALVIKSKRRRRKLKEKNARRYWVRPWLLRREVFGHYESLMQELAREDVEGFVSFQRLCPELFQYILSKVGPLIERRNTTLRSPIPPAIFHKILNMFKTKK